MHSGYVCVPQARGWPRGSPETNLHERAAAAMQAISSSSSREEVFQTETAVCEVAKAVQQNAHSFQTRETSLVAPFPTCSLDFVALFCMS
eukprot:6469737-Amphidinium_carterae.1